MMARMPPRLFGLWCAYLELEPCGPIRDDLRAAWPAVMTFNANRVKGKVLEPGDLFETLKIPRRQMSAEEIQEQIGRW